VSGSLTLITGRMRKQATGMHKGKDSPEYHEVTALAESHHEDLARLVVEDGGQVVQRATEGKLGQTAAVGSGYCVDGVSIEAVA
jgi:formylmethanofuran dehydrogenase subunit D